MYHEFRVDCAGVSLYCRRFGSGEPLVMIHGSCCDSDFFLDTASYLSRVFTVITYDRRGYTRSTKPPDGDYDIASQAEDAAAVIRTTGKPCWVVAHSAGTAYAMHLAATHPEWVKGMLLHEPSPIECLPDGSPVLQELQAISELIHKQKHSRALHRFLCLLGTQDERARPSTDEELMRTTELGQIFVRGEFHHVFFQTLDYAGIRKVPVVLGLGDRSTGHYTEIARTLSQRLGCRLAFFPGYHNGPRDLPEDFACMATGIFTTLTLVGR